MNYQARSVLFAAGAGFVWATACTPAAAPEPSVPPDTASVPPDDLSIAGVDDPYEIEMLRLLSRAEGLLRIGKTEAAADLARGLPTQGPHALPALAVRAWALKAAGEHDELLALLDDVDLDPELRYLRGAAAWAVGERKQAVADLRELWWSHPDGVWGPAALRALAEESPTPATFYNVAERALIRQNVPAATFDTRRATEQGSRAALTSLRGSALASGLLAAELEHAEGVRLLRAEEFTLAATALRQALRKDADGVLRRVIELRLGEAERRRGAYSAAQKHFAAVSDTGRDAFADHALALAGQMAIEYRRYPDARRLFKMQLVGNPVGPARRQALWGLGWVAFRTGALRESRRFFTALCAEDPFGPMAPRGTYWGARALAELGHVDAAAREMAALAERFPIDYYAYRAEDWLGTDEQRQAVGALPIGLAMQRITHVEALVEAGMLRRARKVLRQLRADTARFSPDDLDRLIAAATAVDSPQVGASFLKARHRRFPADDAAVDRLAAQFPRAYISLIEERAKQERIDAALPVAVVLQESRFNPRATSHVGALGLMQLMPATARDLMKEERRRHVASTAEILEPNTNIRLGVRYLARMQRAFGRRIEYALAAYNAGPGAVTRWRQSRGDLPSEIFVEEIPYDETNTYVRKVLAGLQTYRHIARSRAAAAERAQRVVETPKPTGELARAQNSE